MLRALIVVGLGLWAAAPARAIPPLSTSNPLIGMTAYTPEAAQAVRARLSQAIWGAPVVRIKLPDAILDVARGTPAWAAATYFGKTPALTKWLRIRHEALAVGTLYSRVFYATFTGSKCLVLVNGGHAQGFLRPSLVGQVDPLNFSIASVDNLIRRIAAAPCDVLLSSMPADGENQWLVQRIGLQQNQLNPLAHDALGTNRRYAPSYGSPLRYFVDAGLGALYWALARRSYEIVAVVGLSGGGWTTTVQAAVEPRITRAFAVAGSVPLPYRYPLPGNLREGDWEQYNLPVDYFDLYAMSVAEPGRKSFLLYNSQDSCCFPLQEVQPWADALVSALGPFPGRFGITVSPSTKHEIGAAHASLIMRELINPP